jgi:hypothetical protein
MLFTWFFLLAIKVIRGLLDNVFGGDDASDRQT